MHDEIFVAKDKTNAVITVLNTLPDIQKVPKIVRIKGLDPDALYTVKTLQHENRVNADIKISGKTLEKCGVNIGNISEISDMVDDTGIVGSEIIVLTKA